MDEVSYEFHDMHPGDDYSNAPSRSHYDYHTLLMWVLIVNYILYFIFPHPCLDLEGGLAKSPYKLVHGRVIIQSLKWTQLLIHVID